VISFTVKKIEEQKPKPHGKVISVSPVRRVQQIEEEK
jgi:hypothetical protein